MLITEIAKAIHAAGLGTYDATGVTGTVFIETLPETPDACIAIYATGGTSPHTYEPYERPTLQILVRGGQDPRTPSALAQTIYELLHGLKDTTLAEGTRLISCQSMQSAPVHIGQDANRRHEYSINFEFYIENRRRA